MSRSAATWVRVLLVLSLTSCSGPLVASSPTVQPSTPTSGGTPGTGPTAGRLAIPSAGPSPTPTSLPRAPTPSPQTDTWKWDQPTEQVVADWPAAAALAGVPISAPTAPDRAWPSLVVRGVPGDPTRPVEASWSDGLRMTQAERHVIDAPDTTETFTVAGVDEAWSATIQDELTLYARRGRTLAILVGLPLTAMASVAASMAVVAPGTPPSLPPPVVHSDQAAATYTNPVIRTDFADPAVIHAWMARLDRSSLVGAAA